MGISEKGGDIVNEIKKLANGMLRINPKTFGSDEALKEHIEVYITKLEQLKSKL